MNKKILKICFITMFIIIFVINISYGFTVSDLTGDTNNMDKIYDVGNSIIGILSIIGSAASIIFLIILGIKYMTGSLEDKATYKKTLLPYVIGAVFVFGASIIAKMIYGMFN